MGLNSVLGKERKHILSPTEQALLRTQTPTPVPKWTASYLSSRTPSLFHPHQFEMPLLTSAEFLCTYVLIH